jgi:hypothetical protein
MRMPFVIGADWFQYYDEPTFGRDDGENYDMGLVDIDDRPYRELTSAAASLPAGRKEPVARPDVSGGVPPAPAEPAGDLRPMGMLKSWDRERGFVRPSSRLPLADLYVCWAPDALYLGLCANDFAEDTYYRDKRVPEADRMAWTVHVAGQAKSVRVRIGAGRAPAVDGSSVAVVAPSNPGEVRNLAIMKLPAKLLGKSKLAAGDRVGFSSTLQSHARAYRADWSARLRLSAPTGPVRSG